VTALSRFHPAVRAWFESRLGEPSAPQRDGWPLIRDGRNVVIAAPTGSGKTLAGFLSALDELFREKDLPDETQVVYVSPLRALSNDVQKNLQGPLAQIRALDPSLPEIRVLVRTGDTPASERTAMAKRPPHILVTTPESLYLLLTSASGRAMLSTTRTVIVDEIHALVRDKRGSHLALSLERLEALVGRPLQRVGLSATQKPLEQVGAFLAGTGRECALVDAGTFRGLDLAVEVPPSPLATVCSHEQWDEIYQRVAELVADHRTTLVFVNTRKMAERISAQLTKLMGEDAVTSHHGGLSRERRLDAEQRLKAGTLRALVATASLELGIDIGDVDLVIQIGATRSVATLLQRVGRSGHALARLPKGRIFPLALDDLVEAAALLRCVRDGLLDRTPVPPRPLDILAQQLVAECVAGPRDEADLFDLTRRAHPYRALERTEFDEFVRLHTENGRRALLHRDGVGLKLHATKRARLTALQSGGAIPDTADYQVRLEPDGTLLGTVNEDWAIESNGGDIFQLGNASWRILRVEPGIVRVADAKGQPPSIPFWLGEGPGRTRELSGALGDLREGCAGAADRAEAEGTPGIAGATAWLRETCGEGFGEPAALQLAEFVLAGRQALGCVPTQKRVVMERFFDEAGGTQLVVHAPFGSRINRAWGLALRKRFCVGFGFELQAAANEEAIVLSLGPQHSFPLEEVFGYLHPTTARDVLIQALLQAPMFGTRWRWNAQRALLLERARNGKRVPAALMRMRAEDLLAQAFPHALACPETLPGGPIEVPDDHPIVRQTVEDCLTEAMDVDGFLEVLNGIVDGTIERRAIDTPEPSAFARGILSSQPYTFLDDAPLEERRTQAVMTRRILDVRTADELGALDADAVARVREEAWPEPSNLEEVHEALLWMGYVTAAEGARWQAWLDGLHAAGRVVRDGDRFFAVEATRDPARAPWTAGGAGSRVRGGQVGRRGAPAAARVRGFGPARAHRRTAGLVRPPPAGAHPPLHDRAAAQGDRARHREAVPALPRLLAARGPRASRGRPHGRRRGGAAARGLRDPGRGLGGRRAARARARIQARVAGPAHAGGRRGVGPAVGIERRVGSPRAGHAHPARPARDVGRAGRGRGSAGARRVRRGRAGRPALTRRRLRPGDRARVPAAAGHGRGRARRPGRAGTRDVRLLRRAALAPAAGEPSADGGQRERPLEPAGAGGRDAGRDGPRDVRRAAAAAADRRRLPPHADPRATAGALARHRARLPHPGGARRDPRRSVRGGLRRRAVRASRRGAPAARGEAQGRPAARLRSAGGLGRGPAELPGHPHARSARRVTRRAGRPHRLTRHARSGRAVTAGDSVPSGTERAGGLGHTGSLSRRTKMTARIGPVLAVPILGAALSACAPVFSDLQSAKLVDPGHVEVMPSASYVGFSADDSDSSGHVQDQFGVQLGVGLHPAVELRGRYEHVSVVGENTPSVEVFGIGPKVRLVKDRLALYVPVGRGFGGGDDNNLEDSWAVHPTLLFTVTAHRYIEVNASAKYLIPLSSNGGDDMVAFNLGLGLGQLQRWALRPEVGLLINPGDSGHFYHLGLGLAFRP
jgi:ATP-dependent Lhr-like helicase